jgi:hypothetical protein
VFFVFEAKQADLAQQKIGAGIAGKPAGNVKYLVKFSF